MIPIYVTYGLLVTAVVFLVFYSSLSKIIKASTLTLAVLLGVFVQDHYLDQLGKPIEAYPSSEFVYVHHTQTGDFIKLWVWKEGLGDRLHIIPYTQETAKELEDAAKETKKGKPQSGEFDLDSEDDKNAPGLTLDDWDGGNSEIRK